MIKPRLSDTNNTIIIEGEIKALQVTPEMRKRLLQAAFEYNHNQRPDELSRLNKEQYCNAVIAGIRQKIEQNAEQNAKAHLYPAMLDLLVAEKLPLFEVDTTTVSVVNEFHLNDDQRQAVENLRKGFENGIDLADSHYTVDLSRISELLRSELMSQLNGNSVATEQSGKDSAFLFPTYIQYPFHAEPRSVRTFRGKKDIIIVELESRREEVVTSHEDQIRPADKTIEVHRQVVHVKIGRNRLHRILEQMGFKMPVRIEIQRYVSTTQYLDEVHQSAFEPLDREDLRVRTAELSKLVALELDFFNLTQEERAILAKTMYALFDDPKIKYSIHLVEPNFVEVAKADALIEEIAPVGTPFRDALLNLRTHELTATLF